MLFTAYHYNPRRVEAVFADQTLLADLLVRAKNTPEIWEKIEAFRSEHVGEEEIYINFQSMKIALCTMFEVNDASVHDSIDRLTNESWKATHATIRSVF